MDNYPQNFMDIPKMRFSDLSLDFKQSYEYPHCQGIHRILWISTKSCGYPQNLVDIHKKMRFSDLSLDFKQSYGYPQGIHRILWISAKSSGYPQSFVDIHNCDLSLDFKQSYLWISSKILWISTKSCGYPQNEVRPVLCMIISTKSCGYPQKSTNLEPGIVMDIHRILWISTK